MSDTATVGGEAEFPPQKDGNGAITVPVDARSPRRLASWFWARFVYRCRHVGTQCGGYLLQEPLAHHDQGQHQDGPEPADFEKEDQPISHERIISRHVPTGAIERFCAGLRAGDSGELRVVSAKLDRSEERRVGKECRSRWS